MSTPAVYCKSVTKTYVSGTTKTLALRGIDLEVGAGELMMLVGPSGCGKTTLISVVAGILNQDEGDCRVFGEDLKGMGQRRRTKFRGENIGFVFQQFNLLPTLTAAENAAIPLLINGMARSRAIEKAKVMLDRVGLKDKVNSMPGQLSGGQQQRVAIARSLVHDPRLVVCDEPTSALDHDTGHRVMEMLRDVAMENGRGLIIVTHDARIFGFADRIARMDDGRVVSVETKSSAAVATSHH